MIDRAVDYIGATSNAFDDAQFDDKKADLIERLSRLKEKVARVDDYRPVQDALAAIVDEIRPIEAAYSTRIYDCSREIQKSLGSNAAWAAISMATLGLIKKPED